jgi:hypothetical protein
MTSNPFDPPSLEDAYLMLRQSLVIRRNVRTWDLQDLEDDLQDAVIAYLQSGFATDESASSPECEEHNHSPKSSVRWLACVVNRRHALRLRRAMAHRRHRAIIGLRLEISALNNNTHRHFDIDFSLIRQILCKVRKRIDNESWTILRLTRKVSARAIALRLGRSRWFVTQRLKQIEIVIQTVIEEISQKD